MGKLFPFRSESTPDSTEPQLIEISDDAADDVFSSLSSDTARAILSGLYEDPATASDLSEAVDTSLQNTKYHLERLESAGLIEPVDTWYSSRGNEMTVYAPTKEPLVVTAGTQESTSRLRTVFERLVGTVTILALASVVIDRVVRRFGGLPFEIGEPGGPGNRTVQRPESSTPITETATPSGSERTPADIPPSTPTETPPGQAICDEITDTGDLIVTPPSGAPCPTTTQPNATATAPQTGTETPVPTPTETPLTHTDPSTVVSSPVVHGPLDGSEVLLSIPPGALFFCGGLFVAVLAAGWWYWNEPRLTQS
jgi:DNA-binding transcriptional ArsR family regulator